MLKKIIKFDENDEFVEVELSLQKAFMNEIDNPAAVFTCNQVMIVNSSNESFTSEQRATFELLINEKGGQNVAESRN